MRTLTTIMKSAGILLFFTGGAGMDSQSVIVPAIMAFAGIGIAYLGQMISEAYSWQR